MTETAVDNTASAKPEVPLVLIVDDEPTFLDIYSTAFQAAGFRTATAKDGVEALDLAIRDCPVCIILDVIMPVKDGFETLRDLKVNPKTCDIPVIMLSNLGQDFEKKRGVNLGAAHFLVKTGVQPKTIINKCQSMIKKNLT
jgi:CheY-like chemotaxis protein